jgi:hypothetical protein
MKLEKAASQLEALWGNRSAQTKCINEYLDRHGRPRIYLRRLGRPQVALPTPLYSREFWTDYNAAMDDNPVKASWLKSGSVAAAVLEKRPSTNARPGMKVQPSEGNAASAMGGNTRRSSNVGCVRRRRNDARCATEQSG